MAETLHFGRAAERLHVAQPAVSQQVRRLEAALGVVLLERDRRGTALTDAGRTFLPDARRALAAVDAAEATARRAALGEAGELRVGLAPSAASGPLLEAVAALRALAPDLALEVRELRQAELAEALRSRTLDVALLALLRPLPPDAGVALRVLARDPFVAALPARHPLAGEASLALAALADEPFVAFAREQGPLWHDTLRAFTLSAGFTPREEHVVRELPTQLALVAAGLGVALVPASTRVLRESDVAYVPLEAPTPIVTSALAWPEGEVAPTLARLLAVLSS